MSKFFCGLSGIECEVSYLPLKLSSREYAHPVFFLPQSKLLGLFSQFSKEQFTDTESYLLFLALLNSTELVEFRVPAKHTARTAAITNTWMNDLTEIVFKINTIKNPAVQFPRFVISPDTADLKNAGQWIQIWNKKYQEFLDGNKTRARLETLDALETRVHRLILDPNASPEKYATHLANWAEIAASFPVFTVTTSLGVMGINEYWKTIIRKCFNQKAMFDIPAEDVDELYNHCCESLELGTLYSSSLLKLLKEGKERQISYLGLGDLATLNGELSYQILDESDDSTQNANMIALISSAPKQEPRREDYPSMFEFQRARIKYKAATRNILSSSQSISVSTQKEES